MNQQLKQAQEVTRSNFDNSLSRKEVRKRENSYPRHIFIFFDGTWNEERTPKGQQTAPTNVLKMFQELNFGPIPEEKIDPNTNTPIEVVAFYYRGVGSIQDNTRLDHWRYGFNGKDEERIRSSAFVDVYRNYRDEKDRIYILGFSRGAASARLLARNICEKGLPDTLSAQTSYFANLLTGQIEPRVNGVTPSIDSQWEGTVHPKIAFLGCWDTVDAFVLPSRFPNNNKLDRFVRWSKNKIHPRLFKEGFSEDEKYIPLSVEKAVHCVAIDETRNAFLPTLMQKGEHVEEVWFPGVHSDVGGGYEDNMLSVSPYKFMKKKLLNATKLEETLLFNLKKMKYSDYCFHFHGLNVGATKWVKASIGLGTALRKIKVLGGTTAPKIHRSLLQVMEAEFVFAADKNNKRTWPITYTPYNVTELENNFDFVD